MVKNKFVLNSAKILSPDQTDVLQNAQEFTQNKAHGRWQRPCVNILQFREMFSQMDVWTINTVSTLCHVLGCLDDHEHLACLGALVRAKREDETRLEST